MKPKVATRSQGNVIHVILPEIIDLMKQQIGPQASFSITKLRKALAEHEGTSKYQET